MRSRGSGTKREDGRWQTIITLTDENGGKVKVPVYGDTQREMQTNASIRRKKGLPKRSPNFDGVWSDFINSHVTPLAEKTQAYYRWTGKRIVAKFGKVKPSEIKPPDVRKWLDEMALEGVGGRSIQMHRNCLRVFLGWCREQGITEGENSAVGVKLPVKTSPQKRNSLTPAMARLIRIKEPDPAYKLLWWVLAETAMRPSEALRMEGEDVGIVKGVAMLNVRGTKTELAERQVPIPILLAACLPSSGRVFDMDIHRVEKRWRWAVERAGLDHTNLYQLRKHRLSEWARLGIPPEVLKTWAGHSTIELTQNVYVRVQRQDVLNALKNVGMSRKYVNPLAKTRK